MRALLHILLGADRGGCEWDALCLIQQAPEIRHEVLILGGPGEMSGEFEAAGASVRHARVIPGPRSRLIACIREKVKRKAPTAIMVWHGMVALPFILHALRQFPGKVLVHAGNPASTMPCAVDVFYFLTELALGQKREATYVCCSEHVADSFSRSLYLRRFPRIVVPNGVKPLGCPPHVPREIRAGEPLTIGMTARLDPIKDHSLLLRAFALFARRWPAARLELAGDGVSRRQLEHKARAVGIGDRVRFLGTVKDVYAVMRGWDIFAYATTAQEGQGNALVEAMLLGLPCVVTKIGPMQEVGAGAVRLVDPSPEAFAKQLLAVASSGELRRSLGAAARHRAATHFSPKLFAERHLDMLFRNGRKTILHILMGAARGGCEGNAHCLMLQTPEVNHRVLILGENGDMVPDFEAAGAEVWQRPGISLRWKHPSPFVANALREWKPNGVIVWHGMLLLPEILHALRGFAGPVLVHGGNPAFSMRQSVDLRFLAREWALGKRVKATYVCCSHYVADSFGSSRYLQRFPKTVVYNGVQAPGGQPYAPRTILTGKEVVIGMTARLDAIKDHATLLRAFAILVRTWPAARLELAGDGNRRPSLEALAAELGITAQVRFLGMLSDVYAAMRGWDIFAYSTTPQEGLGNALLEAMLLGLPCVVTDVGPVREVLDEPPVAKLVPPANPAALAAGISALAADLPLRTHLSTAARTLAEAHFSRQAFAKAYLGLLEE